MANVDPNFHLTAVWSKHLQSDGSNVAPGAPDPVNYGHLVSPPGYPNGLLIFEEGAPFAVVEFYTKRTILANTGRLQISRTVTDLGDFYKNSQIREHDCRMAIGGKMFNWSTQIVSATNMVQVSGQDGKWVNTGFIAPPLVPGVPMEHNIVCGFDTAAGAYGIQQIIIGGEEFEMPYREQELTATPTTWGDGAYDQEQLCLGASGGRVLLLIEGLTYAWS